MPAPPLPLPAHECRRPEPWVPLNPPAQLQRVWCPMPSTVYVHVHVCARTPALCAHAQPPRAVNGTVKRAGVKNLTAIDVAR